MVFYVLYGFPWCSVVKNLLPVLESLGWSLAGKIPWRRAWQPTPGLLPGESPWMEEPGSLQFMGSHRVGHDWVTKKQKQHVLYITWTFCWSTTKEYFQGFWLGENDIHHPAFLIECNYKPSIECIEQIFKNSEK